MEIGGTINLFLNLLCLAAIMSYLWRYFGFVGFDLAKFKPASAVSRIWNIILAVGFPLIALSFAMNEERKRTLVGIGISTILVPAIIPDIEPPDTGSALEWVYFRTAGKAVADFMGTAVVYVVLLVCGVFGFYWVAAYAGIAIILGIGRYMWIQTQVDEHSAAFAPVFRGLLIVFFASFGWILFLTTQIQLTRGDLQTDLSELYGPTLWGILGNWILGRLPRLAFARRLLPKV